MKNRNKYHAQSQKQAYLFLAPSMLILTVFVFIPLIGALVISVMNIDIYMNNISFAGFGNYLKMFHDSRIGNATFNSFYFHSLAIHEKYCPHKQYRFQYDKA